MSSTVKSNIETIEGRIGAAAGRAGRTPEDISLVVVTKSRTVEEIQAVIDAGAKYIGENRVREAEDKRPLLKGDFTFRMIGHLQRNKAADAVKLFDAIDSVDSIRLAVKLSEELEKCGKTMPVLIEVNSSGEQSKSGFEPEELEKSLEEFFSLGALMPKGLMTIGPLTDDAEEIRAAFRSTRVLFEKIKKGRDDFEILSMGMSDDFEIAIEEGSNMVRIGRAVFERR